MTRRLGVVLLFSMAVVLVSSFAAVAQIDPTVRPRPGVPIPAVPIPPTVPVPPTDLKTHHHHHDSKKHSQHDSKKHQHQDPKTHAHKVSKTHPHKVPKTHPQHDPKTHPRHDAKVHRGSNLGRRPSPGQGPHRVTAGTGDPEPAPTRAVPFVLRRVAGALALQGRASVATAISSGLGRLLWAFAVLALAPLLLYSFRRALSE
jgi:hypothetical protein